MRNNIQVSIITICKNSEDLIEDTIVSVLEQGYSYIEYIIVDGLSKDKTLYIINSVLNKYPNKNVRLLSEPDQGISDAMNKGVRVSKGELIAFLHAGDSYINKDVIGKVVENYKMHGWRWGVASSFVVDDDFIIRHEYKPSQEKDILLKKNCIPHQSTFLVRDVFDQHGYFNIDLKQAMDYEFWLRLVYKGGESYRIIPFNTTYFREGGKSSDILELLKYTYKVRRLMDKYGCKISIINNFVFLLRITAFYVFYQLKKWIK